MWFLYTVAVLFVLVAWYTSPIGREWLKTLPSMQWYYGSPFAEKVETVLFRKSDMILMSRFKVLMAGSWQVVLQLGAVDPSPFLIFVPERFHAVLLALPTIIVGLDGLFTEIQRRWTTKPLVVVAVPEATPIPSALADAMKSAEVAKDKVVVKAIAAEAKA